MLNKISAADARKKFANIINRVTLGLELVIVELFMKFTEIFC